MNYHGRIRISNRHSNWYIEDKRGRLKSCGLTREEAKRMVKGTSNRARQW
jgi:hypothetical protein